MAVNFTNKSGILEGADPTTGTEWCWFQGDKHITVSRDGDIVGELSIAVGASVSLVKKAIRQDAKAR